MNEPSIAFCRSPSGARIAYATWGSGPVLVIPPGWVSHLELQWHCLRMQAFYARLAESFRLVLYDRRGVGLSERARDEYSLEGELADLEAVIDRVTSEPVALAGISHGGPVAIAYAAAHPERTRALALYGTFAHGPSISPPEVQRSLAALVRASWGLGARALASMFVPTGADPDFFDTVVRFQREATDRETAARLLELGFRFDVTDRLRDVRCPTLVIARRHDRAIASRLSIELAARIEGARFVLLEGDAHFPWFGDWEPIAELIEDFAAPAPRAGEQPGVDRAPLRRAAPREAPRAPDQMSRPYRVMHYRIGESREESTARIALAQIGAPEDIPRPGPSGLYRLPGDRVDAVVAKIARFVTEAAGRGAHLVVFPEMSVDLGHPVIEAEVHALARAHDVIVVSGGHHDEATRMNVCSAIGKEGVLWRQRKHVPALLRSLGGAEHASAWIEEPIETPVEPLFVVASTRVGRVAITICRDFLDLDLRVALKNTEPAIDLVLNPAFTPVTADFETAHLEARRALYACTVFCNYAAFGGSLVTSPEKHAARVAIPGGEERLALVEIPLPELRAERRAWDERARARFVQSTRHA